MPIKANVQHIPPSSLASECAAAEQHWDSTTTFAREDFLDEHTPIQDGFFDCGRGWGEIMEQIGGPDELLRLVSAEGARRGREVILFNSRADPALKTFTSRLLEDLALKASTM
eukprot:SAG31_NODE_25053_length_469_cov_0.562162_1_plen_112_part_10